jgi:ribonuclease HI
MELQAAVSALEHAISRYDLSGFRKVIVYCDSTYVVNNQNNAMFTWPSNRWMTKDGNPVLHADLWKRLNKLRQRCRTRIEFRWVKGHAGNRHNNRADKLAKASANSGLMNAPRRVTKIRRKTSAAFTKSGSVKMRGQRLRIRVVQSEYVRKYRLHRLRYEVLSQASKYVGLVDMIWSEIALDAGHTYLVTVNRNDRAPRILKVLEALD